MHIRLPEKVIKTDAFASFNNTRVVRRVEKSMSWRAPLIGEQIVRPQLFRTDTVYPHTYETIHRTIRSSCHHRAHILWLCYVASQRDGVGIQSRLSQLRCWS
jgi:hypothetical protein